MGLALLVGLAAGVGAALLIWSIRLLEDGFGLLEEAVPGTHLWIFVSVPLGLTAAWFLAARLAPEAHGDGVPRVMANLAVRGGHMRARVAPVKVAATAVTLASGGSGGREGPIVQIGASIGSSVARWSGLGEDRIRSLVAAGAGAGIGASFNAPIAGMLFALEVILGHFSVRHLNAVVVASVAAAVTTQSLVGEELTFAVFPYRLADPRELALYAGLGLLAVGAAFLFLRTLVWAEQAAERPSLPAWAKPALIGLAVAGLGWLATRLPGSTGPLVLGTGQEQIGAVLQGIEEASWWVLAVLAALKIAATSATIAARASAGAFMPSLFVGAMLGAGFAKLVAPVWGISELAPGAFALVGMAAVFAAVARAPLTSILIVFEITGDYRLILPLMLATSLATFITDRLHPDSVYTMPLARRGIRLVRPAESDLLDTVTVGDVMGRGEDDIATPAMSLAAVQGTLDRSKHHGLPVLDERGRLVGMISITDIARAGGPADRVLVADAMTPNPVTVTPSATVSVALERMANLGIGRIPVVDEEEPTRLVGMFRRVHAVDAYHLALAGRTHEQLAQDRLRQRTAPGASFFEFEVPAGSVADEREVREVRWPEGLTLVSVRRGTDVIVPTGPSRLRPGDIVTAFGTPASHARLLDWINSTMEQPAVAPPPASAPGSAARPEPADDPG